MRSSIFSFDRAEGALTVRQLVMGLVAGVLLFAMAEQYWRVQGASEGYVDSKPRWSWLRAQATRSPGVVLLGNSRMQFGFSLASFRDRYPETPVYQLAAAAERPYAALRNLAEDERFSGTVLMSFEADNVMAFRRHEQQAFVDHYQRRWTIDTRLNFYFGDLAERWLITRHQNYGIDSVIRSLVSGGGMPRAKRFVRTRRDREIDADYSNENIIEHRGRRENDARVLYEHLHPVSENAWLTELNEFLELTQRIQNRGGCVIVVRFPSQGSMYDYEERLFPKARFWSHLEAQTSIRAIHFEELEIMDSIELPDFQHVGANDKYRFTDALLEHIAGTKKADGTNCKL